MRRARQRPELRRADNRNPVREPDRNPWHASGWTTRCAARSTSLRRWCRRPSSRLDPRWTAARHVPARCRHGRRVRPMAGIDSGSARARGVRLVRPCGKPLAAPVLAREIAHAGDASRLAAAAGAELVARGYHAQVTPQENQAAVVPPRRVARANPDDRRADVG